MKELELILNAEPQELLSTLPDDQARTIRDMLMINGDYLLTVDNWLTGQTSNTFGFGGTTDQTKIYRDKIMIELEKFLCGDKKYKVEREKLKASTNRSMTFIVGAISGAIGAALGTAAAFLMPVVVLLLLTVGKISLNGWCEARKQIRSN